MISVRHGSCMNSSTGGKRDVQEEADGQVGPQRAQHFGHQLQLVVLYPHGPAVGRGS